MYLVINMYYLNSVFLLLCMMQQIQV